MFVSNVYPPKLTSRPTVNAGRLHKMCRLHPNDATIGKAATMSWNHNVHYHDFALGEVPQRCHLALDAGCGRGALTRKIALLSDEVIGIDSDHGCLDQARTAHCGANLAFLEGDVLTEPLPFQNFDFIVAVATLHHLPLRRALCRFRELLRPGGVLVIVGLYRIATPIDYAYAAAAMPISMAIRFLRGEEEVGAPLHDPSETLATIRRESAVLLPGSVLRRRLFFRYSLVWRAD
jgi:SAM-dependent methyltransferase